MNAPSAGICTACGRPLDSKSFWLTSRPNGVHDDCRQWSREAFPFEGELVRLRRFARGVRGLWRIVIREGRWLAGVKRRWPRGADAAVAEWNARRRKFQAEVERLKSRLRL